MPRRSKKELVKFEPKTYFIIKRGFAHLESDDMYDCSEYEQIPYYYETLEEAMVGFNTYCALLMINHVIISNPEELWNNLNILGAIPVFTCVLKHIIDKEYFYEVVIVEKYSFEDR